MSSWIHSICVGCWELRNPNRHAHRVINTPAERCCFCGKMTTAGIYVRHNPKETGLHCKEGKDHEDD